MKSAAVLFAFFGYAMAEFPSDCPNVTLIHGVKDKWYDACLGLQYQKDATSVEACKAGCYADMNCSVWQYINDDGVEKCWSGNVVHGCLSRTTSAAGLKAFERDLVDGERIQHGFIKVVSQNDFETLGLKPYPESTGTEEEKTARCKEFCYTDVSCTVWQYGADGCWLEHGPYNFATGTKNDSVFAKSMVAGETIEHTCPPYVEPEGLPWPWIIAGIVLGLLALAALIYFLQKKPKVKKTRAIKTTPKPEPQITYFIPQPTVLIPQTSVVQVPTYQPVQQPTYTYTTAPTTATAAPVTYAAPTTATTTPLISGGVVY